MSKYSQLFTNFRLRKRLLALVDAFIVLVAGLLVNLPLPIFSDAIGRAQLFSFLLLCAFSCFACQLLFGAYNKLWRYFNLRDYLSCVKGIVGGFVVAGVLFYLISGTGFPIFSVLTCVIATVGVCLFRYMFKGTFISLVNAGLQEGKKRRTMIIGAGEATRVLLDEIKRLQSPKENDAVGAVDTVNMYPVCLIDDDRYKIGKLFHDVLVAGGTSDIEKIARLERIEQIIFAIPSCPPKDRAEIGRTHV